jgi:hypothetical protein
MRRRLRALEQPLMPPAISPLAQRVAVLDVLTDAEVLWLDDLLTRRAAIPDLDDDTWIREHLSATERQELERLNAKIAGAAE